MWGSQLGGGGGGGGGAKKHLLRVGHIWYGGLAVWCGALQPMFKCWFKLHFQHFKPKMP